jgi:hypothetical protein
VGRYVIGGVTEVVECPLRLAELSGEDRKLFRHVLMGAG